MKHLDSGRLDNCVSNKGIFNFFSPKMAGIPKWKLNHGTLLMKHLDGFLLDNRVSNKGIFNFFSPKMAGPRQKETF